MKSTSEGEQRAHFIQPARDSKTTVIGKIQTALAKMLGKHFVWFAGTDTQFVYIAEVNVGSMHPMPKKHP
jgi:hypothetical protein